MTNQETGAKEIELRDDDPDSVIALLRYIYGLPYTADTTKQWFDTLLPRALVYVVANKYQVEALRKEVCENMRLILNFKAYLAVERVPNDWLEERLKNRTDFTVALQTIIAGTTTNDTQGRKLLMDVLIQNFPHLRRTEELASLLKEVPELGVEIIAHDDFECDARGFWDCADPDCDAGVPNCKVCKTVFEPHHRRTYRYDLKWPCHGPFCKVFDQPTCKNCETRTCWTPFGDTMQSRSRKIGGQTNPL